MTLCAGIIYSCDSNELLLCVSQTEERRTGAEDVVSAREQEGADGAAGGADEAAQGDTQSK